jgi:hypothetical protein
MNFKHSMIRTCGNYPAGMFARMVLLCLCVGALFLSEALEPPFARIESLSVNKFNDVTLTVSHNVDFVIWFSVDNINYEPMGIVYQRAGQDIFALRWQDWQLKFPVGYFVVTTATRL